MVERVPQAIVIPTYILPWWEEGDLAFCFFCAKAKEGVGFGLPEQMLVLDHL